MGKAKNVLKSTPTAPQASEMRPPVAEAATDMEETNGAAFAGDLEQGTAENDEKQPETAGNSDHEVNSAPAATGAASQNEKSAPPAATTSRERTKALASQLAGDSPPAPIVTGRDATTIGGNESSGPVAPTRVVSYITVRIPILEPSDTETGYRARARRHIDLQLDRAQAEAMRHVSCALDHDDSHRLNNGGRIARHADVARYILDQIVAELPSARALVDRSKSRTLAG